MRIHGSESRLAVGAKSAAIVGACVDQLIGAGFAAVIVVAANPVDLMSLVAFRRAGLPSAQVLGTGTVLDTMRLRQNLSTRLDVAAGSIEDFVLGEHGDSEVAAFSTVRIGGVPLAGCAWGVNTFDRDDLAREVREEGYRVVSGKGYTSFGIATAIVRICEAIVRDERAILSVSTLLTGQYGFTDLYMSLPCVIGAAGVARVLEPALSEIEHTALQTSVQTLRDAAATI